MLRLAVLPLLLLCAACGSPPPPRAVQAAAPAPSTHDADCKNLVAALDDIDRAVHAAQERERGDVALRDAIQTSVAGAARLDALHLQDASVQRLAGGYTDHMRQKRELMTSLLPQMERFSTAVEAVKTIEAESEPELAPCKQQKKLSKACEAKLKVVVDRTTAASMEAGLAQNELRERLADPATRALDDRLGARYHELGQQLHDQCGAPLPTPDKQ